MPYSKWGAPSRVGLTGEGCLPPFPSSPTCCTVSSSCTPSSLLGCDSQDTMGDRRVFWFLSWFWQSEGNKQQEAMAATHRLLASCSGGWFLLHLTAGSLRVTRLSLVPLALGILAVSHSYQAPSPFAPPSLLQRPAPGLHPLCSKHQSGVLLS